VENAAAHYLGKHQEELITRLNRSWYAWAEPDWTASHTEQQELRNRQTALDTLAGERPLTHAESWERIGIIAKLEGEDTVVPLIRCLLDGYPEHVAANFSLGRILLQQSDPEGIRFLEAAMELEIECEMEGCHLIFVFLSGQGNEAEAEHYRLRAMRNLPLVLRAMKERDRMERRCRLAPHGLSSALIQRLQTELARHPAVGLAYLARKVVKHFPERPIYYLYIIARPTEGAAITTQDCNVYQRRLLNALSFPGKTFVTVTPPTANAEGAGKTIQRVAGAEIYRAD